MAVIRTIVPGNQAVGPHRTQVDCTFQKVIANDGTVLLHIATFGSDQRKVQAKASQQIQIASAEAQVLLDALLSVFPGLKAHGS